MKLNQVISVLQGVKNDAKKKKTEVYHQAQKRDSFEGISRTYEPQEDDGFVYPPEYKHIQLKVEDLLKQFAEANKDLFNYSATQDWANQQAKADVVVGDRTVLLGVPVSYLLFLEKQLEDVKTFISSLPVQDVSEQWELDAQNDCYATAPKYTTKTKKVTVPVILYEATKEHPAQVKESTSDIPEGKWKTVRYTGAITKHRQNELLDRVEKLTRAVVFAREQANQLEVEKIKTAEPVFDFLFSV